MIKKRYKQLANLFGHIYTLLKIKNILENLIFRIYWFRISKLTSYLREINIFLLVWASCLIKMSPGRGITLPVLLSLLCLLLMK